MLVRRPSSCLLALALVVGAGGCPKPRTSAATQPTPVAFDPAQSDPKALAVIDAAVNKQGGLANWEKLKELKFTVTYKDGDTVKAQFKHSWDRWNGRHYFVTPVMSTMGGKPEDVQYQEVKHDLFDLGAKPWAASGGREAAMRKDAEEMAKIARQRLAEDLYFVALLYKLRDPGVKLSVDNAEITVEGMEVCQPSCTSIKVTFDPAVGKETWFVNFNNESGLPEVLEKLQGAGRIGYQIGGWVEAGGLQWPTRFQNIGLRSEVIEYSGIAVGEPDDATYVPTLSH